MLNYKKKSWALKNWCFWSLVLEKTLESPLDCKEIQPVHPKGNQSWISIGRTDVEVVTPILWPSDAKNWLIGKEPAGKDWRQEQKGTIEDEMVGWHHWLDEHEFEQTLGVGDGQGSLVAKSWTRMSDWTELNAIMENNLNKFLKNVESRYNMGILSSDYTQDNWKHMLPQNPKCPSTDERKNKCGIYMQWNIIQ